MNDNLRDETRQRPTPSDIRPTVSDTRPTAVDLSHYTTTVAEAAEAFAQAGLSVTERTIQRYCHAGKLSAVRVNPDTRQLTEAGSYNFLIDPISIPKRIAQLRERQDLSHSTASATNADTSRPAAPERERSRRVDPEKSEESEGEGATVAGLREKLDAAERKAWSLEIDKAARDQMVGFLQSDREKILEQLNNTMTVIADQGKQIGRLEEKLRIAIEAPKTEGDNHPQVDEAQMVQL